MIYLIQLPDDVKSVGYRETRPYQWEQVFCSDSLKFTGTEQEFLRAGLAYKYFQADKYTRTVLA